MERVDEQRSRSFDATGSVAVKVFTDQASIFSYYHTPHEHGKRATTLHLPGDITALIRLGYYAQIIKVPVDVAWI
jgi:hypothetical protein